MLQRPVRTAPLAALLALVPAACSSAPTGPSAAVVSTVVARDGVPMAADAIPAEVVDRLAAHRVVVVGETHHLTEHRAFVAALVRELHARGFRQLLMEVPQMADWLLVDFVLDGGARPGWELPVELGGRLVAEVRAFNRTLPAGEEFLVRAVDANLDDYGGAQAFRDLLGWYADLLPEPGPIATFGAAAYGTAAQQAAAIGQLADDLASSRAELIASWGASRYATVVELVDAERASVPIRANRASRYDETVRAREDLIKALAEERIGASAEGTLVNIGSTHAQKERMRGTDIEWLGDYLVHRSPVVAGSAFVLVVGAARIVSPDGGTTLFRLEASPANELFRLLRDTWPGQTVFLPLDDPLFAEDEVLVNFEDAIFAYRLQRVYDAVLQYPLAHRDPGF
jgi:hypothetical protein